MMQPEVLFTKNVLQHTKFVFQPSGKGLDQLEMSDVTDERVTNLLNRRAHTLSYVNIEQINWPANNSACGTKQINQRPKAIRPVK